MVRRGRKGSGGQRTRFAPAWKDGASRLLGRNGASRPLGSRFDACSACPAVSGDDPVLISSAACHTLVCLAYIVGIIAGWFYARSLIASRRLWDGPAPLAVVDFDDFVIRVTLGIHPRRPHRRRRRSRDSGIFVAHPPEILELLEWRHVVFDGGFHRLLWKSPSSCLRSAGACPSFRSATRRPPSRRTSNCPSVALPTSSTASGGAGRPAPRWWAMVFIDGGRSRSPQPTG